MNAVLEVVVMLMEVGSLVFMLYGLKLSADFLPNIFKREPRAAWKEIGLLAVARG